MRADLWKCFPTQAIVCHLHHETASFFHLQSAKVATSLADIFACLRQEGGVGFD